MHYANAEKSQRLTRVIAALESGGWLTTRDIIERANVCAVNSAISEIRRNGYLVETRCAGRGVYEYKMVGPAMMAS